ncbi:threonine/serine exporter family protein [Proteiniclasticum sp.]|uniref:threonine/serine exporter family protein n=1 Tax=Proteiniclasticum sp. TaxID=2053595 RepID=UPI0028A147C5|nr:threonine/serine exporter family protein [Proteiniclasticum sp.]
MLLQIIMAYIASLSFAFIFNLNRKTALMSAIGGSIGWLFYSLGLHYFNDVNTAYFLGAVALSYYGEVMARKTRTPVTSYITPALIPLVPGSGLYQTMLQSLEGNYNGALREGITTLMASGGLAIGILMVFTLIKIYYLIKRRVLREAN